MGTTLHPGKVAIVGEGKNERLLLARCDHCGMMTTVNFKKKKHPHTMEETYFECDVCGYHYTCFVTDKKVRNMHKQAKMLRMQRKQKELDELQEKINKRMAMLKQRVMSNA